MATESASPGTRGLDRERVDRAVVEALLDRRLDQAVLVDLREALELGGRDRRPQVVAAAGLRRSPRPRRRAAPPRSSP